MEVEAKTGTVYFGLAHQASTATSIPVAFSSTPSFCHPLVLSLYHFFLFALSYSCLNFLSDSIQGRFPLSSP